MKLQMREIFMADPGTTMVVQSISYIDPIEAFAVLRGQGLAVLLDRAAAGPDTGRYSVVAVDPVAVISADWQDAFAILSSSWAALPKMGPPAGWPIGPGLYGAFGYELRRAIETVPSRHPRADGPADLLLGLYDTVVVFDVIERRAAVIACEIAADRPTARLRIEKTAATLAGTHALQPIDWREQARWVPDLSAEAYARQVERALDYIRAGDIYQVNFTQRWMAPRPTSLDSLDLYRRLRSLSPAPYAALIEDGCGNAILSASPERFLSLAADGTVDTRPIKGTRPRGASAEEDRAFADALSASAKDRAENLMIVDLLRNDIGRVAETGSVKVPELNALYRFASVHHLVSTVTARLRPDCSPVDLIRAAFPGGSVTGAPKIRAMQIIDELEAGRRGVYCGAIGWIGLNGAMELSIVIRTLTMTPDRVIAQAGGGIVADSDPEEEYAEALNKAIPMLATLDPRHRRVP